MEDHGFRQRNKQNFATPVRKTWHKTIADTNNMKKQIAGTAICEAPSRMACFSSFP